MKHATTPSRRAVTALLALLMACGDTRDVAAPRSVATVRVSPAARELQVGQSITLVASTLAQDGSDLTGRPVVWSSGNPETATVSGNGRVEAVATGIVSIRATSEGREGTAVLTIVPVPVFAVTLDLGALVLIEGRARQVTATPVDAAGHSLPDRATTWTSVPSTVATVSAGGEITAVGEGEARVTATVEGKSASLQVTVLRTAVAEVRLDRTTLALNDGESYRLTATALDADGFVLSGRVATWASSSLAVASVNAEGKVTASQWGIATITARVGDRLAEVDVAVSDELPWDLLYHSSTGPVQNAPELHRLDLRTPRGGSERLLAHDGAWDVTSSPDGQRIAFAGSSGGSSTIFVANADGSNVRELTADPSGEDQPSWSPDGSRIAFRRWAPGGAPGPFNRADVWVMSADGTGQRKLTNAGASAVSYASPSWGPQLPDGSRRIAMSGERLSGSTLLAQLYAVLSNGTGLVAMTQGNDYLDAEPAWSPDGTTIAFVRSGHDASGDVWLLNVASGNARSLFIQDPADQQRSPAWSPDGGLLAFSSKHEVSPDHRWTYQLYTVRADGTGLVRRSATGIDKERPSWIVR